MIHPPGTVGEILRLNQCWKYGAKFTKIHRNQVMVGSFVTSFAANKSEECVGRCIMRKYCKSVNLRESDNFCELNSQDTTNYKTKLELKKGWNLLETSNEEQNVSDIIYLHLPILVTYRGMHDSGVRMIIQTHKRDPCF